MSDKKLYKLSCLAMFTIFLAIPINFIIFFQGDHVWIPGSSQDFKVPIGAQVVLQEQGKTKLISDDGKVSFISST